MTQTITQLYDDHASAQRAVQRLREHGLTDNEVSYASHDPKHRAAENAGVDPLHDKDHDGTDDRVEGAATGGTIGGIAGGALGAAAGLGAIAIPGIGPVVAAGWLASTLAGAAAGGAAGGIIGALAGAGTREEDAHVYAEGLRRGGTLVTARVPDSDAGEARALMADGAVDPNERRRIYQSSGWTGYDPRAPLF